jgi:hypothetical protein
MVALIKINHNLAINIFNMTSLAYKPQTLILCSLNLKIITIKSQPIKPSNSPINLHILEIHSYPIPLACLIIHLSKQIHANPPSKIYLLI